MVPVPSAYFSSRENFFPLVEQEPRLLFVFTYFLLCASFIRKMFSCIILNLCSEHPDRFILGCDDIMHTYHNVYASGKTNVCTVYEVLLFVIIEN